MIFEALAIFTTGLFAGAAIYISIVEHPVRLAVPVHDAIAEFRPSCKRAALMQVALATLGFLCALGAWIKGTDLNWLIGALCLGAVAPFTRLAMHPLNVRLLDPALDTSSDAARVLLERWGRLHSMRGTLGLAAFAVFLLSLTA